MNPGAAVRARAAQIVAAVLAGENLDRSLASAIGDLPPRDRGLCRELCYGTLRLYPRLNGILGQLLHKPLRKRDQDVQALALVGLYQLSATRIPAHAAVSATVDGALVLRKRQTTGMLNAVLRRYQREQEELLAALPEAAAQAHPTWLWESLGRHWPEQRAQIVEANNQRPPMTLRVNESRIDRDAYGNLLRDDGFASHPDAVPGALTLEEPTDVDNLPGFHEGLCSVQDAAAQWAARLLAPAAGERILDACAAPGGKTCHLLELQPQLDTLVAMDISGERLLRVQDNLERLRLSAVLVEGDGVAPPQAVRDEGPFDAMLVDVPCSATGVIRRHPDIKVLRRPGDATGFADQQLAILNGLWPLLKPGGRLLYVTCSVLPEENQEVVGRFLESHGDARVDTPTIDGAVDARPGQQLLPAVGGGDGLFFSLLHRD